MKNFDDLKDLWSKEDPAHKVAMPIRQYKKRNELAMMSKQFKNSALGSCFFTMFILWFAFLRAGGFVFERSYTALTLLACCAIALMLFNLYSLKLINRINETLAPKKYLRHWLAFYRNRLQFFTYYGPALVCAVCISFGLYLPEILGRYPTIGYKIGFIAVLLVFLIGYLFLGNHLVKQEKLKLKQLHNHIHQLYEE